MNIQEIGKIVEILLVEDNPGDVRLTQEAFKEGRVINHMNVVGDGEEALSYLRQEGTFADVPRPDMILLDLNMPKKDGRWLLSQIKSDPEFKNIPVIVLTTSQAEQDILKSYDLHANCYITKPVDLDEFYSVIKSISDFWLSIVKLPGGM